MADSGLPDLYSPSLEEPVSVPPRCCTGAFPHETSISCSRPAVVPAVNRSALLSSCGTYRSLWQQKSRCFNQNSGDAPLTTSDHKHISTHIQILGIHYWGERHGSFIGSRLHNDTHINECDSIEQTNYSVQKSESSARCTVLNLRITLRHIHASTNLP